MTTRVLGNGQSAAVGDHQWDSDSIVFRGTSSSVGIDPVVTFSGTNDLGSISVYGYGARSGYGVIQLNAKSAVSTNGVHLSNGRLAIDQRPGGMLVMNGKSWLSNHSTLGATALYGLGSVQLNGAVNIDGTSTVNMDYMPVTGRGTFRLTGEGALLRLGSVSAAITVKLDSGMLSLTDGMRFLGTITDSSPSESRISASSSVQVFNTWAAVAEVFDRSNGVLELLDANGQRVAHLKFAGRGDLYARPDAAAGSVVISSHPSQDSLPVTFAQDSLAA